MFDPQTPCYFLTPRFIASEAAGQPVIDPATLATVGQRGETVASEIEAALDRVTRAQATWKRVDAKSRAQVLHRLANRIEETRTPNHH